MNNTSLCRHWSAVDANLKTCSSLHFHRKSVCVSVKITELRNLQCLSDVGSFTPMSLFIDTTDVANLGSVPDILSLHLERVTSPVVLSLIQWMWCLAIPLQLWNVIQDLMIPGWWLGKMNERNGDLATSSCIQHHWSQCHPTNQTKSPEAD